MKYPFDYLSFFEDNRYILLLRSEREEVVKREKHKGDDLHKLNEEVE
jgi:hypothetical protein